MTTEDDLRHRIDLKGTIKNPKKWSEGGIYGIAFSFPFLTNGNLPKIKGSDNQVEQLLFIRQWSSWSGQSLRYKMSLKGIEKAGMSAYLGSEGNTKNFWNDAGKPKFKVVGENTLEISGSRYLDQPGTDRDWTYGQTRHWVIGFSD